MNRYTTRRGIAAGIALSFGSRGLLTKLLLMGVLACTLAGAAEAKTEYREVSWTWRLYGPSSGDFDSPEAAIAEVNAIQERNYNTCAARNCGGTCGKTIYKVVPDVRPPAALVNGRSTFVMTDGGTNTSYTTACTYTYPDGSTSTTPASGPHTTVGTGSIAASSITRCPDGWGGASGDFKYTQVNGYSIPTYKAWCQRDVPDMCPAQSQPPRFDPRFGNPVDAIAQAKVQSEVDYRSADGLLQVSREYSSLTGGWRWGIEPALADFTGRSSARPEPTALASFIRITPPGLYGNGPTPAAISVARSFPLLKTQPDTGQQQVWVFSGGGNRTVFSEVGVGTFSTQAVGQPQLRLASEAGVLQWLLRLPQGEFQRFSLEGELLERRFVDGKSLAYGRQANALTVTSLPGGRSLVFDRKAGTAQFEKVTLPDGRTLAYEIGDFSLILSVTYADGAHRSYLYGEAAFLAANAVKPMWLTGLVNEKQERQASYTYDGSGPISTELAGGVNKFSFSFYSGLSYVTTPLGGATRTVNWSIGPDGERRLTSQSQPAGSGCSAASSSVAYDTNGNVASRSDFKGNRTCHAHDLSRDVETTRVEGLSAGASCSSYTPAGATLPAGARKVSTDWHPDWRLETRVAEPGKLTTSVYNGQPDPFAGGAVASCAPSDALLPDGKPIAVVCKRVEQATTDANGASGFNATLQAGVPARQWSYTYNRWGQVLSEDGPRTDVADLTTYEYYADTTAEHTLGDLKQVTNAAGQTTTYTKYNPHGQVLESVDANGTVTSHTYDLRQRLLSSTTAGQTTSYEYEPTGDLKKLTQPDGRWVAYGYDAARRLTSISDSTGNSIVYTLDNAGNRTKEEVKDPGGVLARQLTRVYDALGRVQQTTGRE